MVLLLADSFVLIFIMTGLGLFSQGLLSKVFRTPVHSGLMGIFLTGLVTATIYFNILSFWLPVNCWSLIPLSVVSLVTLVRTGKKPLAIYFRLIDSHRWSLLPIACLILLILSYMILPAFFTDSVTYHYETILWYETYKVIPGLANVHGRFAYNPCSFIIQSAFSFTRLTGQSIYPLNVVITSLFLFWLLGRMIKQTNLFAGLSYLLFFILSCRALLIYISCPNSDTLFSICIAYASVRLFEALLFKKFDLANTLVPMVIAMYAPIAKLSAFTVLLFIPYFIYLLPDKEKKWSKLPAFILLAGLLYLPWIGRTFIMSGHLLYPFPILDIFHPDWKVPDDVFRIDYSHIRYTPIRRLYSRQDITALQTQPFLTWFVPWITSLYTVNKIKVSVIILFAAFLSPLLWLINYWAKKRPTVLPFFFWLILYASVWIWLVSSPDFRFGNMYMALSLFLPVLYITYDRQPSGIRGRMILPLLFILVCMNYIRGSFDLYHIYLKKYNYAFTRKNWLFPLKDYQTTIQNDTSTFPYKMLNAGTKLYLPDSTHDCLNAGLPCLIWNYGEIEMRGNRIEDGFRSVRCEAWKHFPFL